MTPDRLDIGILALFGLLAFALIRDYIEEKFRERRSKRLFAGGVSKKARMEAAAYFDKAIIRPIDASSKSSQWSPSRAPGKAYRLNARA